MFKRYTRSVYLSFVNGSKTLWAGSLGSLYVSSFTVGVIDLVYRASRKSGGWDFTEFWRDMVIWTVVVPALCCKGLGARLIFWIGFLLFVLTLWVFDFLNVTGSDNACIAYDCGVSETSSTILVFRVSATVGICVTAAMWPLILIPRS